MKHCEWCATGLKAAVVAALRTDEKVDLRAVAKRLRVGFYYAEKVRARARKRGCLTAPDPLPLPPRPVAWTLPPIGAVYVRA